MAHSLAEHSTALMSLTNVNRWATICHWLFLSLSVSLVDNNLIGISINMYGFNGFHARTVRMNVNTAYERTHTHSFFIIQHIMIMFKKIPISQVDQVRQYFTHWHEAEAIMHTCSQTISCIRSNNKRMCHCIRSYFICCCCCSCYCYFFFNFHFFFSFSFIYTIIFGSAHLRSISNRHVLMYIYISFTQNGEL